MNNSDNLTKVKPDSSQTNTQKNRSESFVQNETRIGNIINLQNIFALGENESES